MTRFIFSAFFLLTTGLMGCGVQDSMPTNAESPEPMSLGEAMGGSDTEGYRRADRPRAFSFPEDHGPHEGFRNEWWYITGNLDSDAQDRIGFHITFFRVALAPAFSGKPEFRDSPWVTRHLWMGHSAVTDLGRDRHVAEERFAREGAGLAGAEADGVRIWLEDWTLEGLDSSAWQLQFGSGEYRLQLELEPLRDPVLQGDQGLSQKGREPGNASYYYSIPRLRVTGEIEDDQGVREVTGLAWLDREWSTSALEEGQIGWDWFALQFFNGDSLMYYQLRRQDGSADSLSKGRWMPSSGPDLGVHSDAIQLRPLRYARMTSGRRYPVEWEITWPEADVQWTVVAIRDHQEMTSFIPYWEGAVDILDSSGNKVGRGFVEMTGYDN